MRSQPGRGAMCAPQLQGQTEAACEYAGPAADQRAAVIDRFGGHLPSRG